MLLLHTIENLAEITKTLLESHLLGVCTVIEHPETVAAPPQERYGADFKKMNKAAAIQ